MKHCTNCGFDINRNESICPHCGYQFSNIPLSGTGGAANSFGLCVAAFVISMFSGFIGLIVAIVAMKKADMSNRTNKLFIIMAFVFSITKIIIGIMSIVIMIIGTTLNLTSYSNNSSTDSYKCKNAYTCTNQKDEDGNYVCIYKKSNNDTEVVSCKNRYDNKKGE